MKITLYRLFIIRQINKNNNKKKSFKLQKFPKQTTHIVYVIFVHFPRGGNIHPISDEFE